MRLILGMTVGALALSSLAACGGGEESFRATFRTQALANCRAGADPSSLRQLSQIGMSADQLCTCAIDRYMRGASIEQLRQDRNSEMPPALRTATMQCVTEQMRRAGATPGAAATNQAAPGPEAAPAAPAAPAEPVATEENSADQE